MRGWVRNSDLESDCFDLKWVVKNSDVDYTKLFSYQFVNHFYRNSVITTKIGLNRNLNNLIYTDNVDVNCFFPKCYDLREIRDFEDFVEDFKLTQAASNIKKFVIKL